MGSGKAANPEEARMLVRHRHLVNVTLISF
jgi:hypothetical protein